MSAIAGVDTLADSNLSILFEPTTIRERCGNVLARGDAGLLQYFRVDRSRLDDAASRVIDATRRRYPDLHIPYHSRWRHFASGGIDRAARLSSALDGRDAFAAAAARIDLTVVSVLLDAGAGPDWSYREASSGRTHTRSEGLAVATFDAFMAGEFSADANDSLRVDASRLLQIDASAVARLFQVDARNPLLGVEGRAALLRRLGAALEAQSRDRRSTRGEAGDARTARPALVFEPVLHAGFGQVSAGDILRAVLDGFRSIWLAGTTVNGAALGDVWRHPQAGGEGPTRGFVPFHKLSQWLAYSLFEPFEWAGIAISNRDALTGLPEYRNGGLLLDTGVLRLIDADDARRTHDVGSTLVVEWRALTVALLDVLAERVRARLARPDLPLACILEGGTWAAGREIAQELRGGTPPLAIRSDGTVF